MSLPIDVIVPHMKRRESFFHGFTLPSIRANLPNKIIVIKEGKTAGEKRNRGVKKSTSPYLFFCDDDDLLRKDCLSVLYKALKEESSYSFAYCNYVLVIHREELGIKRNIFLKSKIFNFNDLTTGNYINTNTLVRRADFIGFDEDLHALEDWEMWLRMGKLGKKGLFINRFLFLSFHLDKTITLSIDQNVEREKIYKKHSWLRG